MKKKILFLTALAVTTMTAAAAVGSMGKSFGFSAFASEAGWRHYEGFEATTTEYGVKEYWTNCSGVTQLTKPEGVDITEAGVADVRQIRAWNPNDERLIAPIGSRIYTSAPEISVYPTETSDGKLVYTTAGETEEVTVSMQVKDIDLKTPTYDFKTLRTTADVTGLKILNDGVYTDAGYDNYTFSFDKVYLRTHEKNSYLVAFDDNTVQFVTFYYYNLLVKSEDDLRAINSTYLDWYDDLNTLGRFKLANDIEMTSDWTSTDYIGWNSSYDDRWKPSYIQSFNGTFDGNGHKISNLNIRRSSNMSTGFIYALGTNGVIKNINIEGSTDAGNGGLGRGSMLCGKTLGGHIEDVTVTVSFAGDGYDKTHIGSGLLGFVSEVLQNDDIHVKNATVIAADATTSNADWSNAIGLNGDDYAYNKTIYMENVTFVGFKHLYYDVKSSTSAFDTVESLPSYFQCTNVKAVEKAEYYTMEVSDEADIVNGYDFSKVYTGATLTGVTCEGAAVDNTDGVVDLSSRLNKWKTSETGVKYFASYSDGTVAKVTLDIYTVLVKTEDDLRNASKHLFIYDTPSMTVGYIKIANDIEMTSNWTLIDQIGLAVTENGFESDAAALDDYSSTRGFMGTLDGGNHKITNFNVTDCGSLTRGGQPYESCGLVHALAGGTIKNLTLEGTSDRGTNTKGGFLVGRTHAGTIDNVTLKVSMTSSGNRGRAGAALLGSLSVRPYNDNVYVNNVTVIAGDETTGTYDYTNPIGSVCDDYAWNYEGVETSKNAKIYMTDVSIVGFKALFYDAMADNGAGGLGVAYYNVSDFPSYFVNDNVTSMTLAEYNAQ